MPSILRRILETRRVEVAAAQQRVPEAELKPVAARRQPRDFLAALRVGAPGTHPATGPAPRVIAELKRASPSRGRIRDEFDVGALAAGYQAAGAAALSVLTEESHFEGHLDFLRQARSATRLPLLRKDFVFSTYQVWEAAAAGADAVLLIAAMLDDGLWERLLATAREAGLTALSEVHDADEMERALRLGAACIGVNNRDLHSFEVDIERAVELGRRLPAEGVGVAESGLRTRADLKRMAASGFSAVLIGEAFMSAPHPGRALARLLGGMVKVCGLTSVEDARAAGAADAVGFVFAASPRQVTRMQARALAAELPEGVLRVGVFAGAPMEEILATAAECGLDRVQLHGDYPAAVGAELSTRIPVWRALGMPAKHEEIRAWAPYTERFLLDAAVGGRTGGHGVSFDWDQVPELARRFPELRLIVAGGLGPDNVGEAIRRSGTFAVDAASGLESAPGRKQPQTVTAFIEAARAAFEQTNV